MADRIETLPKSTGRDYLQKAERFCQMMKTAAEAGNWEGAALAAVHTAISTVDAVTVFYLGQRSRGQKHEDAAALLTATGIAGVAEKRRQFLEVLRIKNLVEYEARTTRRAEAEQAALQAERLFLWAKDLLR